DPANDPDGDGIVSSRKEWEARREEIKRLVQHYWLGYRWPTHPSDVVGHSYVSEHPHTVCVGFHFPPYAYGVQVDVRQEFDRFVESWRQEQVEIHQLRPAVHFCGSPTVGEVIARFGPAADAREAEKPAIEAWNAGYYIPYEQQSGIR